MATPKRLAVLPIIASGSLALAALSGCSGGSVSNAPTPKFDTQGLTAETQTPPPKQRKVTAKVALLLPLGAAGQSAVIAKGMKQAAEMALFESNQPTFQMIVKDTKGTEDGAAAAANAALSEGAELIIGPLFAKSVTAAAVVARRKNIPIIAFSNDERVAGPNVYLLSFQVSQDVQRIISFASAQGKRQFVALVPDNDYGTKIENEFRAVVAAGGGIVVAVERYPEGMGGILGPAHKLIEDIRVAKESGIQIDAFFAPGGPDILTNLGSVIRQEKLDTSQIQMLGTGGWDYPNISRERAFIGGWYPAPDPKSWRLFSEKFSKSFGSAPPRIASLTHNATTIAIRLASMHEKGNRYTTANLTRQGGFVGADGIVRFTAQGLVQRGLAVLEVQKFGPQVISPASQTFLQTTEN
ncbi:MAG: penicillin-binding protein activator [Pseudomonadota bacterium]